MQQRELENLLTEATPQQIRQRWGSQLTAENEAFLNAYAAFGEQLDGFHHTYTERFPAPPATALPPATQPKWFLRKLSLPLWSVAAGVAALLIMGILSLSPASSGSRKPSADLMQALSLTRSTQENAALQTHNTQLIQALLDRGFFFFEQGTEADYRQALSHFMLAYNIDNQNPRALKYLILVSQALGMDAETRRWRQELEALEKDSPSP